MTTTTTATTTQTSRRRMLAPLATLLAAAAIIAASGATFSATTTNPDNIVATGSLEMTNDRTAIFANENMKPGDWVIGDVTITNSGTLPAAFTLSEVGTNPFGADATLKIVDTSTAATVYEGPLAGAGAGRVLGEWAAGEARTFVFTVTLSADTPNSLQGATATTAYTWDSVQTDGVNVVNEA